MEGSPRRKYVLKALREIRVAILGFLFTITIVPVFIFIFLPIYLFRFLLSLVAPLIRPDLGKIVSTRSSVVAFDDLYGFPKCTLLTAVTVEGDVDIEVVRQGMLKKIVLAKVASSEGKKNPNSAKNKNNNQKEVTSNKKEEACQGEVDIESTTSSTEESSDCNCAPGLEKCLNLHVGSRNNLFYPEFQQFYTTWCGFTFYKWDNNFSIENHVRVYEPSTERNMTEMDVGQLRMDLVRSPYVKNRSPWEIIVVKNFVPNAKINPLITETENGEKENTKSVVLIRIHHAMSDGYSLLQIFMTQMIGEPVTHDKLKSIKDIPKPRVIQKNCLTAFGSYLGAVILVPYTFVRNRLECRDQNPLHIPEKLLTKKNYSTGEKVRMEVIHQIRASHENVNFTAVLLAMIAGGIRNFMIAKNMELPQFIRLVTPLPRPGHPSSLRNYWSFCVVKLPIGLADPIERLRYCQDYWERSKSSARAAVNFSLIPIIGGLNNRLMNLFIRNRLTTVIMSNFPGPPSNAYLFGHPVLDASFGGGLGRGNLGFGFAILSINGFLNMNMGIDQGILKSQAATQELMSFVTKEVQVLLESSTV